MKRLIISALLAGFGATVVAQEIIPFDDHFVSSRTRAEVQADVSQAALSGELYKQQGEITSMPSPDSYSGPSRTRSDVLAELSEAAASGELYRQQGEITWAPSVFPAGGSAGASTLLAKEAGADKY